VDQGDERNTGRVGSQRPAAQVERMKSVRREQPQLELIPSTFGSDGE
jgi:hypothetical protein